MVTVILCLDHGLGHSRMRFWFAKLQPSVGKSLLELSRKPWAGGKATDEECKLFLGLDVFSRGSEHTDRVCSKAFAEIVLDNVHSGLDRGFEEL